jgi:hypothetical protein
MGEGIGRKDGRDLVVGDVVYSDIGQSARVELVGSHHFEVIITGALPGLKGKLQKFPRSLRNIRCRMPMTCGQPVCDFHLREVAEDRHYCMDHWQLKGDYGNDSTTGRGAAFLDRKDRRERACP